MAGVGRVGNTLDGALSNDHIIVLADIGRLRTCNRRAIISV
jgi:hypothetical protein